MGDPRKIRKKYQGPNHPWEKERIDEERGISKEYGVKNKKELWKIQSKLRQFKIQAKRLIAATGKQSELEKNQLIKKLQKLGLIKQTAELDDILGLTLKDLMDRRLQTLVHKKNLARSVRQSRQFIVHNHIAIGNQKITSPSYLVSVTEEPKISFAQLSQFSNQDHPERFKEDKK